MEWVDLFYQLFPYTDDVDLYKKLADRGKFYNLWIPHFSHGGKTSYKILHEEMKSAA